MTSLTLFSFPPEAKVLEVTPTGVVLELPPTRPSAPPRPLPMPADEQHPDWRWRKLHQAGEAGNMNLTGEPPAVLNDDPWLQDRILPCWRHANDPLLPRGSEQDAYQPVEKRRLRDRQGTARPTRRKGGNYSANLAPNRSRSE